MMVHGGSAEVGKSIGLFEEGDQVREGIWGGEEVWDGLSLAANFEVEGVAFAGVLQTEDEKVFDGFGGQRCCAMWAT